MAGNTLSPDVTYTVIKLDPSDPAMPAIMEGNYKEMNASYCDQDNQYFRVFQTPDDCKFIFAETPQNPGIPIPYKLIPVMNKHGPFRPHPQLPKITSFSQISKDLSALNRNTSMHHTRNPIAIPSYLPSHHPNLTAYSPLPPSVQVSQPVAPPPVQFVGMKKFLLDAISEEMQRSYGSQTPAVESCQQESSTTAYTSFSLQDATPFINNVSYPPLELSEEENDFEELSYENAEVVRRLPQASCPSARNVTRIPGPVRFRTKPRQVISEEVPEKTFGSKINENEGDGNCKAKEANGDVAVKELSKAEKIEELKNKVLEYLNATKEKRQLLVHKENMLDNGSQCSPETIQPAHPKFKMDKVEFLTGRDPIKGFVKASLLGKPTWRLEPTALPLLLSEKLIEMEESKKIDVLNNNTCDDSTEHTGNSTLESANCVNSDHDICSPRSTKRTTSEIVHADILECLNKYTAKFPSEGFPRSYALRTGSELTKLVLQRVADDDVLEVIGKTAVNLKYLDVSGSPLVTNEGIQQLLLKSAKENTSLYLMSSWVHKNVNVMNDMVRSLEHLNFSYTAANFYSRRLVNLLPGSYVFPRIFHLGDNDTFGHHIFYRRPPDFASPMRTGDSNSDFEIQLRNLAGMKGATQFIRFSENFAWKNCYVSVRDVDKGRKKIPLKSKKPVTMIVTAASDEKRVCGEVVFESGSLAAMYSLLPVDMNLLGEHCPNIQRLSTQLIGAWRQKKPFLPNLVKLDIISEPETILSIFQNCSSLKSVKIRVKDGTLHDEEFLRTLSSPTFSRNLRELWIVPSLLKAARINKTCPSPSRKHSEVLQRRERLFVSLPNKIPASVNESELIDGIELKIRPQEEEAAWENSCKLTINAAKALCTLCTELTRLGNLAWWSVTLEEFESFKYAIAKGEFGKVCVERESLFMTDLDLSSSWEG